MVVPMYGNQILRFITRVLTRGIFSPSSRLSNYYATLLARLYDNLSGNLLTQTAIERSTMKVAFHANEIRRSRSNFLPAYLHLR